MLINAQIAYYLIESTSKCCSFLIGIFLAEHEGIVDYCNICKYIIKLLLAHGFTNDTCGSSGHFQLREPVIVYNYNTNIIYLFIYYEFNIFYMSPFLYTD